MNSISDLSQQIEQCKKYIINDFELLEDYEIIQNSKIKSNSFVAIIKNSQQKVRFIKKKYHKQLLSRFATLYNLFCEGIVLADNMFIFNQCGQLYFYIIQAEIQNKNPRFQRLSKYLYKNNPSIQIRQNLVNKIKIMIDCLHCNNVYYAGLDIRSIIIDKQNQLYLSPFQLQYQLRTDNYSRAYYPIQILQQIQNNMFQISQQTLYKWDIWAYGCISMQILQYQSPYFLSTSLENQKNKINSFLNKQNKIQINIMKQIISNCFKSNDQQSTIKKNKEKQRQQGHKSNKQQNLEYKQLNIDSQGGQTYFILYLQHVSKLNIQHQARVVVYLDKEYSFFIDHQIDNNNKYFIRKKITIYASFQQLKQILIKPIQIQFKESSKIYDVQLNLQTLVLTHQNKRIWNEELVATFSCQKKLRLKIRAILNEPKKNIKKNIKNNQNICLKETIKFNNSQKSIKQAKNTKKCKTIYNNQATFRANKQNSQHKNIEKHLNKQEQYGQLPSISQIAQSINILTQKYKQKLSYKQNQENEHEFQKKIKTILQI